MNRAPASPQARQPHFDDTVSGATAERPGLTAALAFLRDGDVLVVWRLDRLGRSLPHLIEVVSALEARGVGFRSLTEAIDTTNAGGKLVFHIFGELAEFEHSLIRERTLAGLAAARARGRKSGRSPALSAAMLADPQITKAEVAKHFGVSRVTLNASLEREGVAKAVNRPKLEQLLAECDPGSPEMEALRAWQEAPAVGCER